MSEEPTIAEVIRKHQELKNAWEEANEAFQEEWKPYRDGIKALENYCCTMLQKQGLQNSKVEGVGTAYLRHPMKVTVDNRDDFLAFVVKHNKWDMLDAGVLVDPVRAFLEEEALKHEHDPTYVPAAAPPGIAIENSVACSIRKG